MSGKADFTSIQFLICHLQSHMYKRPKVIPANWQEMKAGVDPTEEKGVSHPFPPPRGDLRLLLSLQATEQLLLLLYENCTPFSPFLCPLRLWQEGRRAGEGNLCVRRWGSSREIHLAFYALYILTAIACFSYSLPGLAVIMHSFCAHRQTHIVPQLSTRPSLPLLQAVIMSTPRAVTAVLFSHAWSPASLFSWTTDR